MSTVALKSILMVLQTAQSRERKCIGGKGALRLQTSDWAVHGNLKKAKGGKNERDEPFILKALKKSGKGTVNVSGRQGKKGEQDDL